MDLRRIRHFIALAETLNFHRAAERLHMTQPPLSVSIQKLEVELGAKLFERKASGVSLTLAGKTALKQARKLIYHSEQIRTDINNALSGTGGVLRVGFVGSATSGLLQRLTALYRAQFPGVELILSEATSVEIMQGVEDQALDIGLVRVPLLRTSRATVMPLEREAFVAALPFTHALVGKDQLQLRDLANEGFIMYAASSASGLYSSVMLACQQAGFLPLITQEATQIQTVLALVETGLGVALVPAIMQNVMRYQIAYRSFTDFPEAGMTGLSLAYMASSESPAAEKFRLLAAQEYPGS